MENNAMTLAAALELKRLFGPFFAVCYLQDRGIQNQISAELLGIGDDCLFFGPATIENTSLSAGMRTSGLDESCLRTG